MSRAIRNTSLSPVICYVISGTLFTLTEPMKILPWCLGMQFVSELGAWVRPLQSPGWHSAADHFLLQAAGRADEVPPSGAQLSSPQLSFQAQLPPLSGFH